MNISDSETISLTLSGDDRSRTLSGLTPYSLYQVNISAFTVSTGPSHSVFVMTEQAGSSMISVVLTLPIVIFLQWVVRKPDSAIHWVEFS